MISQGIIEMLIAIHSYVSACVWIFCHRVSNVAIAVYFSFQFRNFKIVYRRYAGLYFCICVDVNDNNLCYLEAIHNFVEVLNEYFHNVCELDLVFNFYKASTWFLISDFRHVLSIVCNLLGISPVSDYWMPTFRNTLSVPSSKAGCEVWRMVDWKRTCYL